MLGDFHYDDFKEAPNNKLIWPMFLLCNFLLAIVFMNMLIAIMGQTFSDLQAVKTESDLEQKVSLMSDYENLFDMVSYFRGKKYIIHAKPSKTDAFAEEPDLALMIEKNKVELTKYFSSKVGELERHNAQLVRQQNAKIYQVQKTLNNIYAKSNADKHNKA